MATKGGKIGPGWRKFVGRTLYNCDYPYLLVASLHGALPLREGGHVAVRISKHLCGDNKQQTRIINSREAATYG